MSRRRALGPVRGFKGSMTVLTDIGRGLLLLQMHNGTQPRPE